MLFLACSPYDITMSPYAAHLSQSYCNLRPISEISASSAGVVANVFHLFGCYTVVVNWASVTLNIRLCASSLIFRIGLVQEWPGLPWMDLTQ